jgi:hypothetical protein
MKDTRPQQGRGAPEEAPLDLDFSELGGRKKTDGTYPSPEEWLMAPAKPADTVFADDKEVESFFHGQIQAIDDMVRGSKATRESVVSQIKQLEGSGEGLVTHARFATIPAGSLDSEYFRALMTGNVGSPTESASMILKATMNVSQARSLYPKLMVNEVEVKDFIIKGKADPHAITIHFGRTDSPPWMYGMEDSSMVSVSLPGADNTTDPTQIKGLYKSADPEAIAQTLAFCTELSTAIFATRGREEHLASLAFIPR